MCSVLLLRAGGACLSCLLITSDIRGMRSLAGASRQAENCLILEAPRLISSRSKRHEIACSSAACGLTASTTRAGACRILAGGGI